jgi:acetoin:2,6-dichlorophenolindophenol oxidoreductase subunit alpha
MDMAMNNKLTVMRAYRKMLLTRLAEEAIINEYFDDEMKTPVHLSIGAEAITAGICSLLPTNTVYYGTYRSHALYLSITEETDKFFAELYGKVTGISRGKAGSMHLSSVQHNLIATSAIVGSTLSVAVGSALASKYQNQDNLTCVFFGDGAMNEGSFYESLNFATLHQLPIIFVCEDNDLAIHSKRSEREGFKSIEQLVKSFNIDFYEVDGSNLSEVLGTTQDCYEKLQHEVRPAFIHAKYYRFLEHVGTLEDYKAEYRTKPKDLNTTQDPIYKAGSLLKSQGINQDELNQLKLELTESINISLEKAKKSKYPAASELYEHVFDKAIEV